MIYCDASLLVAALTREPTTAAAQAWLAQGGQLLISAWVDTEVASAIARKRRMARLAANEADEAFRVWTTMRTSMKAMPIEDRHFRRASALVLLSHDGLRGPDALHVALAEEGGHALATLDRPLLRACAALGIAAFDPLAPGA